MRAKIYIYGVFLMALTASTMTYATGVSLWGDTNSPSADDASAPPPPPSTAPVIIDDSIASPPADQATTVQSTAQTDSVTPADNPPATSIPTIDPVITAPPPKSTTKNYKAAPAPVSKNKTKKGAAPAAAGAQASTDIDAPLAPATGAVAQKTICDVFMQQPTLKSDPLYNSKTRDDVARHANVVGDEFAFLLRDPVNANTLYTQYRDLYIKTYCTK